MRYTILKYGAFLSLLLYFVIGTLSHPMANSETFAWASNGMEVYPLFNWQLFSYIPNEKQEYSIEVYRIGERVYDPPLQFTDMTSLFHRIGSSPTEYTPRIRALAQAIEDENTQRIEQKRKELERVFKVDSFSYGVLKVRLDPVVYWKTGKYATSTVLRVFTHGDE